MTPDRHEPLADSGRRPTRVGWLGIALAAAYFLLVELACGSGLAFNPGWANGWPGGVPFHTAVAATYSGLAFVVALTVATLAGAVLAAGRPPISRRPALIWLTAAVAIALLVAAIVFGALRAEVHRAFPDGYNPRPPAGP